MNTFCPPVITYGVFITAIGLYDIYMGKFPNLARTMFYLIFGGTMLWVICAANMEFIAWLLVLVPFIFYIFLIAMMVFNKSYTYKVEKKIPIAPKPEEKEESKCA
jgi:hypothetical protein